MLKIKEGSSINHYGDGHTVFTSETPLSQSILEHLKTMYPDEIDGDVDIEQILDAVLDGIPVDLEPKKIKAKKASAKKAPDPSDD